MSIPWTARITIPDQVLKRELDGESVILNLDSEKYYGLDDVGTRMLTVLLESDSVQQAFDILLSEYAVEPDILRQDLTALIEQLKAQGIIEWSELK